VTARESRPHGAAPESFAGDPHSVAATDLPAALVPRTEWETYLEGYMHGYAQGIDLGRRQMDDELATIQRAACEVVHRMADLPERDREADRQAAERREARWSN